jgi:hypothetical protein
MDTEQVGSSRNLSVLYLEGVWFESWPGYPPSLLRILCTHSNSFCNMNNLTMMGGGSQLSNTF